MDEKLLYFMWLGYCLPAGSKAPKILLEHYKDIVKIYNAGYDDYKALGISPKSCAKLCEKNLEEPKRFYEYCVKEHIGVLCYDNQYYPERLKCIINPPPLLYYRGRVEMLDDHPCFALVGTRSCSEKGIRYSYRMGYKAAARGAVVVNGLALGCDGAAISGALDADGYAVGVLGCGIDRIYPNGNKKLFERLSRRGLIISEFPPFSSPEGANFPIRNRVISGITLGTVVLEADANSGALITAAHALEQGRKLYAIPGDINDPLYEGPLSIIKSGGKPVTDANDFVSEYELMFPHRINIKSDYEVPSVMEDTWVKNAFGEAEIQDTKKSETKKRTLPKPGKFGKLKDNIQNDNVESKEYEKSSFDSIPEKTAEPEKQAAQKRTDDMKTLVRDFSVLSAPEQMIMELFCVNESLSADEIAAKGLKIDDVMSSLTILEIYGFLRALPGGRFQINE